MESPNLSTQPTNAPLLPARFRAVRVLGEGGMGVVYEALDTLREERVAVKTMRAGNPDAFARFKQEFRAVQEIRHPNLVTLGDLVAEGETWCFSMELVDGVDLLAYVQSKRIANDATLDAPVAGSPTTETRPLDTRALPGFKRPATIDFERLRKAIRQIADALDALHEAGVVHRDVKPGNILVTSNDRVVVLDFGIALDTTSLTSHDAGVLGTPLYMAPEQARGEAVTPAADWYALGVILYEAIVGIPPIEGTSAEILERKQRVDPPAPSKLIARVPADLDLLTMELLRRDPSLRPTGVEVRSRLGGTRTTSGTMLSARTRGTPRLFVGRSKELRELFDVLVEVETSREPRAVLVRGESGVGKTALVRHFASEMAERRDGAVILLGRCYPREDVPFRALDGLVDDLATFLRKLSPTAAESLVSADLVALSRLFPVLRRIDAVAREVAKEGGRRVELLELRRRAIVALRDTLATIAKARSVALIIDDAQWADEDSRALLAAVLESQSAPAVLVIATQRAAPPEVTMADPDGVNALRDFVLPLPTKSIDLDRLDPRSASLLARALLLEDGRVSPEASRAIVLESDGHPLFIDALVRYSADHPGEGTAIPRFDDALAWRVNRASEDARDIMRLLAVAAAPVRLETIRTAVASTVKTSSRAFDELRDEQFVSLTGGRADDTATIYHDRVRAVVLASMSEDDKRELHRRLAVSLEATGGDDFDALASHWERAGEVGPAARYRKLAADRAFDALAFARAARMYEKLANDPLTTPAERATMGRRLGDSLVNLGQGLRAAAAYRAAAKHANSGDATELERFAVSQMLLAGDVDRGLSALRVLLISFGEKLPASPRRALFLVVGIGLLLKIRGLGFRAREPSDIRPRDLSRLELLWLSTLAMTLIDTVLGAALGSVMVWRALGIGSREHVARGVRLLAGHTMSRGGRFVAVGETMYARGREIAGPNPSDYDLAMLDGTEVPARYTRGQFREAVVLAERADQIFRERCHGVAWETSTLRVYALRARWMLGELNEVRTRRAPLLRDALERGDLYASASLRIGVTALVNLLNDDPDRVDAERREAMKAWSKRGFHLEHYQALVAATASGLYANRPDKAFARTELAAAAMRGSMLHRIESVRDDCTLLRARSAVALALTRRDRSRELLALTERLVTPLLKAQPWIAGQAFVIRAACLAASTSPNDPRVVDELRRALALFDEASMALHVTLAKLALAHAMGGMECASLTQVAESWLTAQHVRSPTRFFAAFMPGL